MNSLGKIDEIIKFIDAEKAKEKEAALQATYFPIPIPDVVKTTASSFLGYLGITTLSTSSGPSQPPPQSLHHYAEARKIIHEYLYETKPSERSDEITNKVLVLYDKLTSVTPVEGIQRAWIERLRERKAVTQPDAPIVPVDPANLAYRHPAIPAEKLPKVTARLLFQLQADEFGKNSKAEGMSVTEPLAYVLSYIKERCANSFRPWEKQEELIHELEVAHTIASSPKMGEAITRAAEDSFKTGKPFLIPGGWTGIPAGHAMYYEVIPDPSTRTATICIFNTGAGSDFHSPIRVGAKEKVGFAEWRGVALERLLDPGFGRGVEEMMTRTFVEGSTGEKTEYTFKDIYVRLKGFLAVKVEHCLNESEVLNAPAVDCQFAGTCSSKALMAFVKSKMSLMEFHHFKCDIRIQALVSNVLASSTPVADDEITRKGHWRLVKKSIKRLGRKVDRMYRKNIVGADYVEDAHVALGKAAEWVEKNRPSVVRREPFRVESTYTPVGRSGDLPRGEANPLVAKAANMSSSSSVTKTEKSRAVSHPVWQLQKLAVNDPKTLSQEIKEARKILETAYKQGEYLAVHSAATEFVKKLPIEDQFWGQVPGTPAEIEKVMEDFNAISDLLFKTLYRIPNSAKIFPEKVYAVHKIYFVQKMFARKFSPNIILDNVIGFEQDLSSVHFQFHDEKMKKELRIMREEEASSLMGLAFGSPKKLFGLDSLWPHSENFVVQIREREKNPAFFDILMKNYPEVIKKAREERDLELQKGHYVDTKLQRFDDLKLQAQCNLLYSRDYLPSWMKSLRDMHLRLSNLTSLPIPPLRDERVSLDFMLGNRGPYVEVSIHCGLDYAYFGRLAKEPKGNVASPNPQLIYLPFRRKELDILFRGTYRDHKGDDIIWEHLHSDKKLKIAGYSEETSKDITHIFTSSFYCVVEAVEYFTRHPENLADLDFQQLFQIACFRGDSKFQLKSIQEFAPVIAKFLKGRLEYYEAEGDAKTTAFLLRMSRYFSHYKAFDGLLRDGEEILQRWLRRPDLEPDDKSLIYAELVALLGEKPTLTEEQVEHLLVGTCWIAENPIPLHLKDPETEWEGKKAIQAHSKAIDDLIAPNNIPNAQLLGRIYQTVMQQVPPDDWKVRTNERGALQFYSSNNTIYEPWEGRLSVVNKQSLLPFEIRDSVIFKELFPGVQRAIALPEDVYQFTDAQGRRTAVQKTKDAIIIEQERDGAWYRLVPGSFLAKEDDSKAGVNSLLESRYLVDQYTVWRSISNPQELAIVDPKSDSQVYSADVIPDVQDRFSQIKRLADGALLSKPNPLSLFADIEDLSYIHEWYDLQHRLVEIELPRFKLAFEPDPNDSTRLLCVQHPGWSVATDQTIDALGVCRSYLVLQDHEGKKKVIFPDQEIIALADESMEVLHPNVKLHRAVKLGDTVDFRYFTYDVDAKGMLQASSREGYFHLVETLAAYQEYELAAYYLRRYGEKASSYSPQELYRLYRISKVGDKTGDTSGEQIGISLYAEYLLSINKGHGEVDSSASLDSIHKYARGAAENQSKPKLTIDAGIGDLYTKYLEHFKNITGLRLKPAEEMRILKNIFAKAYDPRLFPRLRELDPEFASKVHASEMAKQEALKKALPEDMHFNMKPDARQEIVLNILEKIKPIANYPLLTSKERNDLLLTRSIDKVKMYMVECVRIAVQGTEEEKKWLRAVTAFLLLNPEVESRAVGAFLKEVLDKPTKFTAPPLPFADLDGEEPDRAASRLQESKNAVSRWWYNSEIVFSFFPAPPAPEEVVSRPTYNITPEHYRLEEKKAPVPKIEFAFQCNPIPPLPTIANAGSLFATTASGVDVGNREELKEWLENEFGAVSAEDDPMQKNEWKRLVGDVGEFKKIKPGPVYKLDATLAEAKAAIESGTAEEESAIKRLEGELKALANRLPADATEQKQRQLREWGGIYQEVTLDDVFVCFAQQDSKHLLEMNPSLDEKDLQKLFTMASDYLMLSCNQQQRNRCLETYGKLEKAVDRLEREGLERKLAEELMAKRAYDIKEHPAYLVFEYYADKIMRADQKAKLDDFLTGKVSNPVMEMIMGSGKSKVLLPLLGILRADGKSLSMVIVPSPLFESVSSDTQDIFIKLSKSLKSLHFDRNSTFTKRSLEEIRDSLKNIIEEKECLIMTSKSVQSLLLKFIEYADTSMQKREFIRDEMVLMEEIVGLLASSGNPLIDEADTVLNVLHEVSFSLGNKLSPKKTEIRMIGEIYDLLYTDPKLKAIAQIESDRHPFEGAPPLTEDVYFKSLQKPLAEAFLERLKEKGLQEPRLDAELKLFLNNLDETSHQLLMDYLCRKKDRGAETQQFYNTLSPALKDVFALAGEEFSHILPHTLVRISDEKYGLDGDVIAIPYETANTPSHGSLFANSYITMNYTFQTHSKKGIDELTLLKQVQKLKKLADIEVAESGGKKTISETEAWKLFCDLKGNLEIPLAHELSKIHTKQLWQRVNSTPAIKNKITADVFLPQMVLYENKLSCNNIVFAALFAKISGFTGTLWNAGSMHRKISTVPEAGTDAKTLNLLWEMSKKKENAIEVIKKGSVDSMIDAIGSQKFDLVSDAGGYFKEGGNLAIARKLAIKFGKPVVFYNEKGEQTVTDGKQETPLSLSGLKEDQRMTFLDQSHTTGADVPQRGQAVGLVTVGRNMLLRDLLQSVWRLRGLEKGQQVKFILDDEVEAIMRQKLKLGAQDPIGFKEILRFVVQNQSKQQGDDNFKAFKQQLWSIPQCLLIDVLIDKDISPNERQKVFALLRETWIKRANLTPSEMFGIPAISRPANEVVNEEWMKCKVVLEKIKKEFPALESKMPKEKEIEDLLADTLQRIHPLVISPSADDNETVEVEQQAEVQADVEMDTHVNAQEEIRQFGYFKGAIKKVSDIQPSAFSYSDVAVFPLQRHMEREPALKEFAPYFADIKISANVLEWKAGNNDISKMQLLGAHPTPVHHLLVQGDDVEFMSVHEEISFDKDYYNLYLGYKDTTREPTPRALEKIVKLKFLNGESNYSEKESAFLEQWLNEVGPERMRRLFLTHILRARTEKTDAFPGSKLSRIFNKLLA